MTTILEDHGLPLISIGEDVPVERETKRCQTCGKPVRVAILVPVYGHVTNPKDQHHVVRLAKPAHEVTTPVSRVPVAASAASHGRTREPNGPQGPARKPRRGVASEPVPADLTSVGARRDPLPDSGLGDR